MKNKKIVIIITEREAEAIANAQSYWRDVDFEPNGGFDHDRRALERVLTKIYKSKGVSDGREWSNQNG